MNERATIRAMVAGTLDGFDAATVEAWLSTVAAVQPPFVWGQLAGGHSNLTYSIRDCAGRELVIRRPPLGHLLPKAHDMGREYRIIEALWPTDVPVPQPVAYCDDRAVAETHFYVMGRCSGRALHSASSVADWLDVSARHRAADQLVKVLAALHRIEPDAIGLGDLGRPTGYAARQIRTWHSSWESQIENAGYDDSRAHELHTVLLAQMPAEGATRVVHGDFGPHNALFRQTGEISAILDWEIATLGDPLADLAYVVNAWVGPNDELLDLRNPPTHLPGFPDRQQIIDRYVELVGFDMGNLAYYRVFSFWRRACILQGVYGRYRTGQKSSKGVDMDGILTRISTLLEAAVDLVEKDLR